MPPPTVEEAPPIDTGDANFAIPIGDSGYDAGVRVNGDGVRIDVQPSPDDDRPDRGPPGDRREPPLVNVPPPPQGGRDRPPPPDDDEPQE